MTAVSRDANVSSNSKSEDAWSWPKLVIYIVRLIDGVFMTKAWQVHEAKARFSELLDSSLKEGPQIVTKRGVETAVLLPIGEWRRLQRSAKPNLKALLLAAEARTDTLVPPRDQQRHRRAPVLD